MKVIQLVVHMKCKWHFLRIHYNRILLEGCLDSQIQKKLQEEIKYHEMKLDNIH
ncbi:hypothetical protein [Rossellomorea vietnamensis]|uniref:hypothetical protein n=1 Tax=Rossellomorea vietnamensis TaxID=218284 RepID=UPI001E55D276|nr:hypothetical protein [Rossellomorea vietnamensis]MCC5804341.1 hypothetical protein [Rossellomorea vietnamensis]